MLTSSSFEKEPLQLLEIEIEKIFINPYQPRKQFEQQQLQELADSISEVGLLHPPLVRYLAEEGHYEIVSGERRFRAAKLAGKKKIHVFIRLFTPLNSAYAALVENLQRVDLDPLEIAKALKRLSLEFGLSQQQLAIKIGKKRSTVANYLRLLTLPSPIQCSLKDQLITMGHAKAILALGGQEEKQVLLHDLILRDDLSVREAEQAAIKIAEKSAQKKLTYVTKDFYIEQLVERIQRQIGTKAAIHHKGKKGQICLHYYSLDDLDRLLNLLGVG